MLNTVQIRNASRKKSNTRLKKAGIVFLEATPRFELGHKGFADPCLTTWLCRQTRQVKKMERMTRLELATSTLARWRSTG